jgi:hypothetical protein
VPDHPGAAEVIARWEEVDRRGKLRRWMLGLWIVVFVSLGVSVFAQLPVIRFALHYQSSEEFVFPNPFIPEGLTESQRLLISDPFHHDLELAKALHLSDPENPAYFAEYAITKLNYVSELPNGFLETAARIDPENSYFLYLAASAIHYDTVESNAPSGHVPKLRNSGGITLPLPYERDYTVNDRKEFERSLELLAQASKLPHYESYTKQMIADRLRVVGKTETVMERINGLRIALSSPSGIFSITKILDLIAARSQELSKAGDTQGFLELTRQSEHLMSGLAENPDSILVNEVMADGTHQKLSQYLDYGATRLGLVDVSKQYRKISDEFQLRGDARRLGTTSASDVWIEERGEALFSMALRMKRHNVKKPPPVTPADLAPGRYAEHDFVTHIGLSAFPFALLILTLPVFLYRFIFPKPLRRTAARFAQLLRPSDLVIAFVFGVLLPIAAILLLNRFTELGGREWSLKKFDLLFPSVHLAVMLLWVLLAPAVILRWRLLRRIEPFGLKCIPGYLSLLALLAISTLAFAAYPIVLKFGLGDRPLTAIAAPLALWGAVVFFNSLLGIIGKAPQRITLAATSLAVLPVYLAAIAVTPLLLPVYKASEIHWLAQDTLFNPDADAPDLGLYDFRLAAQKRKETREILGLGN